MTNNNDKRITTIIFDVDDTLYDVSNGFTEHRIGDFVDQYMVDNYHFESLASAKALRSKYFAKYHSTAKALTAAQEEGKFPPNAPKFDVAHLSEYWANNLDYSKLGPPKRDLLEKLRILQQKQSVVLVAFSNGPRSYVKRVLHTLELFEIFGEERLFAVDDVLPHCKPQKEAFQKIFDRIGNPSAESCIMIEDSMKNIRSAKAIGMKTLLITGENEIGRFLPEDKPEISDPAVDCAISKIEDLWDALPELWQDPAIFDPKN